MPSNWLPRVILAKREGRVRGWGVLVSGVGGKHSPVGLHVMRAAKQLDLAGARREALDHAVDLIWLVTGGTDLQEVVAMGELWGAGKEPWPLPAGGPERGEGLNSPQLR